MSAVDDFGFATVAASPSAWPKCHAQELPRARDAGAHTSHCRLVSWRAAAREGLKPLKGLNAYISSTTTTLAPSSLSRHRPKSRSPNSIQPRPARSDDVEVASRLRHLPLRPSMRNNEWCLTTTVRGGHEIVASTAVGEPARNVRSGKPSASAGVSTVAVGPQCLGGSQPFPTARHDR